MSATWLIDTNILVYAYDLSEPKKRQLASEIVKECWEGKKQLAVSVQNLSEFYVVVTEKIQNPIKKEEAQEIVKEIVSSKQWKIFNLEKQNILDAVSLSVKHKSSYWDALIVSAMLANKVFNIYTEDDFKKFPGINSVNPFEK